MGYWLAIPAMLTNTGCMILALMSQDPGVFLIAWAGACFTFYGILFYFDTGRLPMGYRSLAMQLRWDLTSEDGDGHRPGDKVPTVTDIATKYRTTHTTAMRAMRVLAEEGLVDIVYGRGTYYVGADRIDIKGDVEDQIDELLNVIADRVPTGHPIPSTRSLCAAFRTEAVIVDRVLRRFAVRGVIRPARAGGYVRA